MCCCCIVASEIRIVLTQKKNPNSIFGNENTKINDVEIRNIVCWTHSCVTAYIYIYGETGYVCDLLHERWTKLWCIQFSSYLFFVKVIFFYIFFYQYIYENIFLIHIDGIAALGIYIGCCSIICTRSQNYLNINLIYRNVNQTLMDCVLNVIFD